MSYRQIHTQMWRDEWYLDLTIESKLFWVYLITNDSSNILGLYKFNYKVAVFETGLSQEFIAQAITEFQNCGKVVYQDGYIWIVNLLRYNFNKSDKTVIHIKNELTKIPDIPLKIHYIEHANTVLIPYGYSIDGVQSYTHTHTNTEQEQKQEQIPPNIPAASSSVSKAIAVSKFNDISAHDAERVYQEITGQVTIPSDQFETAIADLTAIIPLYTDRKEMIHAGQIIFAKWCKTIGKNGREYSRTNTAWLTKWLDKLAPDPMANGNAPPKIDHTGAMCGEGKTLLKRAQDAGDRNQEANIEAFRLHVENCRICGNKEIKARPMPEALRRNKDGQQNAI